MIKILLFDVDGTLCDSGKKISIGMAGILNKFTKLNVKIGIVGGGTFEKILFQLDNLVNPDYIFSECGSVYHQLVKSNNQYYLEKKNDLRLEPEYIKINQLVKLALEFISKVDYLVSGNFIDLRNGLIYISLVGMAATDEETNNYRSILIEILKTKATQLGLDNYLDICLGGSVGIGLNPKKWNKIQVLNWFDLSNSQIHFFGDKYLPGGNDYELMCSSQVIPHPVDSLIETFNHLSLLLEKNLNF
jgi:phosphomannomutase